MKILIIGAKSQVGGYLAQALSPRHQVAGTAFRSTAEHPAALDIRDGAAVRACLEKARPQQVLLTAALTNVEYCQTHPREARDINVLGTRHVAEACRDLGMGLTFFSSDYIFDGTQGPYGESDPAAPQSVYGQTKWEGEQIAVQAVPQALIIRTTVVYAYLPGSKNFFMQAVEKLKRGEVMRVPQDQMGNPTHAWNLALAAGELLEQGAAGVFHLTGTTWLARSEFGRAIARKIGADPALIEPVPTLSLNQAAPRPLRAGLKTVKAQAWLKQHPLWSLEEGLDCALRQMRGESLG